MMALTEHVYNAYKDRDKSSNWGAWANLNPAKAALLAEADNGE